MGGRFQLAVASTSRPRGAVAVVKDIIIYTPPICYLRRPRPTPLQALSLISISNHRLDPVNVRAEAAKFHLLALARLDRQRVGINPLVRGDVRRVVRIRKDVEHCPFIDDRQERHCRDNLFQDVADFCLDLCFRFGRRSAAYNGVAELGK